MTNKEIVSHIKNLYRTNSFIPLHEPNFIGNEKKYLNDAIDSTFVSSVGIFVDRFEKMIRDYTGAKHAIAVSNGTSALHVSLLLAGVKSNQIVLTQPFSFIATCNAISYTGAEPYFIDIDERNLGMSMHSLKNFLEKKVIMLNGKAVHKDSGKLIGACVPMHTFGMPCNINEIVNLCNDYKIAVIEDAAESLGSTYNGKHTGTFGLLGVYSFNGNKTITCGGGGIIVTNDDALGYLAKHVTTQAKIPHKWEFKHDMIGYNYRLPNINAALACAQMEQLDRFIFLKRSLSELYRQFFNGSSVKFIYETEHTNSNFWLNSILFDSHKSQLEFLEYSNSQNVMTRPGWELMNRLSMFSNCGKEELPISEYVIDRLVNIPSTPIFNN